MKTKITNLSLYSSVASPTPSRINLLKSLIKKTGDFSLLFFVFLLFSLFFITTEASATKYYLAPSTAVPAGNDGNSGTIQSPWFTLNKVWTYLSAGDTVYLRGGTYQYTVMQDLRNKSGVAGNLIKIWAFPGEVPILTKGSTYSYTGVPSGIYLNYVNYIHFKGIEITGFTQPVGNTNLWRGIFADYVNFCIFENLNSHHNSHGMGLAHDSQGNLLLNCDFHNNYDPYSVTPYGDGDGLEISSLNGASITGAPNLIKGCRSWSNADDGYDCWMSDGTINFDNCWSFWNGYKEDGITTGGDGNGFKFGETAASSLIKRTLNNCLSFENRVRGFNQNLALCVIAIYNSVSYNNKTGRGFDFFTGTTANIMRNNISLNDANIPIFTAQSIVDHNSFLLSGSPNTAYTVNSSDFASTSSIGMDGMRQADGSLPVLNFMHLVSNSDLIDAGTNVGLPYNGTAPDLGAFEYSSTSGSTNQAPVMGNQLFQINENSANGTIVGTLVASDPNVGQSLTFSIFSGNVNNAFSVNSTTGQLTVNNSAALNFEAIPAFPLVVYVQDNGSPSMSTQATITINLINVNEVPILANQSFSINENSANGTSVGTVVASDPDAGQSLSYSILSGNSNNAFSINASSGLITVSNSTALNFETTPTFNLVVKAQDNYSSPLSAQATMTISLGNVNEPPVVNNQTFSVISGSANGTSVGTVIATDPDAGQILSYAITSGNTNTAFSINSITGLITLVNTSVVNYLTTPVFGLTVQVTDNGTGNLTSSAVITVNITQSPNHAPVINNQSFTLNENSSNGTVVGTVVASDPDAGQSLSYILVSGNVNGAFSLNTTTGVLTVLNSSAVNFELLPTFSLTVKAIDNGNPVMYNQAIVTINLINLNEPPVLANQSFSIAENSINGTLVGTVVASDPDAGQTLTYSIQSGNTGGAFTLSSTTGALTVANTSVLNFEVNPIFSLIVNAQDNGTGNLSSQATISVMLTDVNETPVIANQSFSALSGAANGTQVGIVVASDPDAGQTLTYSITTGNTGSAFAINSSTGALTISSSTSISYQSNPIFNLTVKVTDNGTGNLFSNATVTINVLQSNNAPVISNQTFAINENSPNGTTVGTIIATDPDAGQSLSYSILSGNTNNAFSLNAATGVLSVSNTQAINYEVLPTFSLIVKVQDNGPMTMSSQATITVNLLNVNEAPLIANQTFSINENSIYGTVVGNIIASDPDAGQSLVYSFVSGNLYGTFIMNPATGVLTVNNPNGLNFEVTPVFTMIIKVTDNGTSPLSSQATVVVNLINVNEAPVISNQSFTLAENTANGTSVGTVVATDPDAGQALTYSILSGNTNGAFAINSSNGNITVSNSTVLNFESTPSFSLVIKVQDNGTTALSNQATVAIGLTNVNEAPILANQSFSVAENSGNGTVVGTIVASDPDAGSVLTYVLVSGNINGAFAVNSVTGALTVLNYAALNFEFIPTFSLTVKVLDNGSPSLISQANMTVNLINVNEPPVIANQSFSIAENTTNSTSVGTVVANDPDAGQSLTYSILSGNTNGAFSINATSGLITVINSTALNYEVSPVFLLVIKVQDNGTGTLSNQASITVNLTDVNEPPVINNQSFTIAENTASGTNLGTVAATDPDAGQALTFTILSGNTNNAFAINSSTGLLTVANSAALNFETTPSFSLIVNAQDNGTSPLSTQATVSVLLSNVNEPPIIANQTFSIATGSANNAPVGTVIASDPDAGQTLTYAITAGNVSTSFTINTATGLITVNNSTAINYLINPVFNLTVKVTDNGTGNLFSSAAITINVTQSNHAPVIANQTFSVNENSVNGTNVGTVLASDPDAGQTLTYSILSGNTNGTFTLNSTTGLLTVANSTALNFEVTPSFSLVVKVQDNATSSLSSQATITVNLINLNEPPVIATQYFNINENTPNSTIVGTVLASDPDAGQSLTYSILAGNTGGAFSINSTTGVLSVANSAALNYEVILTIALTIKVQDNGTGNLTNQGAIIVNLINVNEAPIISDQSFSINENSPNGTAVGNVVATDPDVGQTLTYSILSGNTNGAFAINGATGALTVANVLALDYETTPSFTLGIRVVDNYFSPLGSQANIVVALKDVIELTDGNGASTIIGSVGEKSLISDTKEVGINKIMADGVQNKNLSINSIINDPLVYPNPSSGIFNVELGTEQVDGVTTTVFDESGKMLANNAINATNKFQLDLSKFSKGYYFVEIRYSNYKFVKKLSLQ
ncbi:MAG: T9SS type A sorting domain-containing protein [Bacteroidetes bacterium]|nr:T9SS type A sorting domain-containing protein [Bacteroidota bacterium]